MELDTFIAETIKSIIKGVSDSQGFAKDNGSSINPIGGFHDKLSDKAIYNENTATRKTVTKIEFDIAVTASNEESNKVGGGLKIQVLSLGASTANNITSQTSSRIKFDLNITLPTHQ